MNEDFRQLRKKLDGSEKFMDAHQIKKIRKREKVVPDWALNDVKFRAVLQLAFPLWRTNTTQRKRAARWTRVIHLYYRLGMPHNQVAEETEIGYGALRSLLRNIRRVAKGQRANGSGSRK